MQKQQPQFDAYFKELEDRDSEIREEMEAAIDEAATAESATAESGERHLGEFIRETIVLTTGRPVLDIQQGAAVIAIDEVESEIWKQRLADSARFLAPNIPAVGRIELQNHPRGIQWLGTGWLIRDNIVVTNRHVAEVFGDSDGSGFMFRPGFDETPMRAQIDFLEEFDNTSSLEFPLFQIMHIEHGGGPDLAFLRIEPVMGQQLPAPVNISYESAQEGDQVAVVGYPARDAFFPNPDLMDRIFQHRYDKKRLAPGLITGTGSQRVFHDCSTLGGNSGGEVVALKTGKAVALHFAGTLFTKNHAVPVEIVEEALDRVLSGRPRPTKPEVDDGPALQIPAQVSASPNVLETTVPIHIRVQIGDAGISSATVAKPVSGSPSVRITDDLDVADDDLISTEEARPEDYGNRDGYDPEFLGDDFEVSIPVMTRHHDDVLKFEFNNETLDLLHYRHFSVLMSESRRGCRFSACNIDGKQTRKPSRKGWRFDPRIPRDAQIMKECYGNPPKFSRGHMTRRLDPAWGTSTDANEGNVDSMHVTNAVPQIQPFNAGIWLDLEDYALENADQDDMRISVFTGPFFQDDDPIRFGVQIPVTFWKVIAFIHDETKELCATGYTMSQEDFIGEDEFIFAQHKNSQRPIVEIESRAGISFGDLAEFDPMREMTETMATPLSDPSQIRWL